MASPAVPRLRVGFRSLACRISELVLGCRDPEVLARFWCEVNAMQKSMIALWEARADKELAAEPV